MKAAALVLLGASLAAFAISLLMPATSDFLGLFWAAFALEVVLRGPTGAAEYPLFLLVSLAVVLALLTPFAFANARSWGRIPAHLLVVTVVGSAIASVNRGAAWGPGWYVWCAALAGMAAAIYLHGLALSARPAPAPRPGRALHSLRRIGR